MKQAKTGRRAAYFRPMRARELRAFFAHLPQVVAAGERAAASLRECSQAIVQLAITVQPVIHAFRERVNTILVEMKYPDGSIAHFSNNIEGTPDARS